MSFKKIVLLSSFITFGFVNPAIAAKFDYGFLVDFNMTNQASDQLDWILLSQPQDLSCIKESFGNAGVSCNDISVKDFDAISIEGYAEGYSDVQYGFAYATHSGSSFTIALINTSENSYFFNPESLDDPFFRVYAYADAQKEIPQDTIAESEVSIKINSSFNFISDGLEETNTMIWTDSHEIFPDPDVSINKLTGILGPGEGINFNVEVFGFGQVETVPEPLTILGAGTAIAFGTGFKRKLAKAKKK